MTLHVALFGTFGVSVAGAAVPDDRWRTNKARHLVKALGLTPGHRLHREQLAEMLWPDVEQAAATKNLRSALHAARVALEPERPSGSSSSFVVVSRDVVALTAPDGVTTDVDAFCAAADDCRRAATTVAFERAVGLYLGDLLPADRYEDWATSTRERLRETWLSLLVELAGRYEDAGDLSQGIAVLERATAAAPSHEDAHVGLMRLHARSGRPGHALRQYARLQAALARDLDVAPMPGTVQMHADIAGGRFGRAVDERAQMVTPTIMRLPTPLDRLVGRRDEIDEVEALLDAYRLVSVTGAGGAGKTRLALEIARRAVESGTRAVWFVDLVATSDSTLVATVVASTLGASGPPERPIVDTIGEAVGGAPVLVVLDNCEHVLDAVVDLVSGLLARCAGLRVLATSREAMRVTGEATWRIPALSMPAEISGPPSDEDLAALHESDALTLLVDRIGDVRRGFAVTAENAAALVEICRRLDGNPLALELAAARIDLLPPAQLADRLGDALAVLGGARRGAPDRQRTLRATLDWSHDLLDGPARVLVRRLAVFAGGWTLDAAEEVCAGRSAETLESPDVLDALARLVDTSMVLADDAVNASGDRSGVRYRMLETVRQYAAIRLTESGEEAFVRSRHLERQIRIAEESETALIGADQHAWRERLERDHDNMRAGLRWAEQRGDASGEGRLAAPLWRFWNDGDHLVEGGARLTAALSRADGVELPPGLRGRLMQGAASLAWKLGDVERARGLATEALAEFRSTGERVRIGATLHLLGILAEVEARIDEARARYEAALAVRDDVGDTVGVAGTLQNLGNLARNEGDPERAAQLYERSLEMSRAAGHQRGVAMSLGNLGAVALDLDDYAAAERYTRDGIDLYDRMNVRSPKAVALQVLGYACLSQGRPDEALTAQQECLRIGDEIGDQRAIALGLEGVAAVLGLGAPPPDATRSAQLLGAAEALRTRCAMPLPDGDSKPLAAPIHDVQSALGPLAYEAARVAGHLLPLRDAISSGLTAELAPADRRLGPAGAVRLTRREHEIAELVADGLTNAAIAARLGIARRTADTHVSNVLRKLGAPSRTAVGPVLRRSTYT